MSRIYLAYRSKNNAFAPYKRFAQQNLGGGRIHFARAFQFPAGIQKRGHNLRCDLFFGAGDEARSQHCRAATRTAGDKRPTGAFSRFARALFAPLPAGAKKSALLRRTSVLRSKTLAEDEFTSPEHFNFLPESKKEVTTYVVTSFLERATRLELATSTLARWRSTR